MTQLVSVCSVSSYLEDVIGLTRQDEISVEFAFRRNKFIRDVEGMHLALAQKKGIRRATVFALRQRHCLELISKMFWEGHGSSRATQRQ
jgi:hypothetical protein